MKRIALLDYGRFFAASIVILFHYFYNGIINGKITSITLIHPIATLAKYGHIGVLFFFMISGYVIFYSAKDKKASAFFYSRVKRLYPSYWFGLLFTSFFIILWGAGTKMQFSAFEFFVNISMLQDLVGVKSIDGVYWTLIYELKFYFIVFLFLLFEKDKWLKLFFKIWPVLLLFACIFNFTFFTLHINYAFFSIGALFAMIKENKDYSLYVSMILAGFLCFYNVYLFSENNLDLIIYISFIVLFITFFVFINLDKVRNLELPFSSLLGALTFPVYLIHAHFGYLFLSKFATDENKLLIYAILLFIVFLLSYLINIFIEKKLNNVWVKFFKITIIPILQFEKLFKNKTMNFFDKIKNLFFGPYLFWYQMKRKDGLENYGDIVGPFLFEKISGKSPKNYLDFRPYRFRKLFPHYLTVGSILNKSTNANSIVWGSGIIKKDQDVNHCTFLAVRGPRTRARLIDLGCEVPEVYGDPALLLPNFIKNTVEKKYELGIIPHYVDYAIIKSLFENDKRIKIIDLVTSDIEKTTREILECKNIISSSLHGVIVSHAYQIPALWVKFSDKLAGDNVKFYDYFESLNLNYTEEFFIEITATNYENFIKLLSENSTILLPDLSLLDFRKEQLLLSCPFK